MRHVDEKHGLDMFRTEVTDTNIVIPHLLRTMTKRMNDAIQNM